jgi:sugar phosphate isomerase/epimerase
MRRREFLRVAAGVSIAGAASAAEAPVPGYPIGRCVRVLGVTAPEDAQRVGFEYLELALQDLLPLDDSEFERVVTRLKAIGIPLVSGYGFLPPKLHVAGPGADWAEVDAALRRGLGRAKQLGLQMVVFGNLNGESRRMVNGTSPENVQRMMLQFGKFAARLAEQHGITILIEPLPARTTNAINTVAEALRLVEAVASEHFQMLVDFGYMTEGREDLTILHRTARHIRQIEIQNPNGRVYPRSVDEADYASFFRALKTGGYRGGFSVHGAPTEFFTDAPRAIGVLRQLAKTLA